MTEELLAELREITPEEQRVITTYKQTLYSPIFIGYSHP